MVQIEKASVYSSEKIIGKCKTEYRMVRVESKGIQFKFLLTPHMLPRKVWQSCPFPPTVKRDYNAQQAQFSIYLETRLRGEKILPEISDFSCKFARVRRSHRRAEYLAKPFKLRWILFAAAAEELMVNYWSVGNCGQLGGSRWKRK